MSTALLPCPSCSRHVRLTEAACPFCEAPVGTSTPPPPKELSASASPRLSRAALYALGAGALVVASSSVACDRGSATKAVYGGPPATRAADGGAD